MRQFNGNGLVTKIPIKNKAGQVVGHKDVVTYRGLLSRAHDEQLKAIETTVIQLPTKDNRLTAIFLAKITTAKGTFTGVGDANPDNVNTQIVPHLIRMAETRAKARALRDAVNIGVVCLEELGGDLEAEALGDDNAGEETDHQNFRQPDNGNRAQRPIRSDATATRPEATRQATVHAATLDTRQALGAAQFQTTTSASGPSPASRQTDAAPAGTSQQVSPPTPPAAAPDTRHPVPPRGPEPMSENQRRYLFRLLAKRDILGEDAKTWLCQALKTSALKDASKAAASVLIDRLVKDDEQGADVSDRGNGRDASGGNQEVSDAGRA